MTGDFDASILSTLESIEEELKKVREAPGPTGAGATGTGEFDAAILATLGRIEVELHRMQELLALLVRAIAEQSEGGAGE